MKFVCKYPEPVRHFSLAGFPIRVIVVEKKAHFYAKDIARYLGYKSTKKALKGHRYFDDHIKERFFINRIGRLQKADFIDPYGLYLLCEGAEDEDMVEELISFAKSIVLKICKEALEL